MPVETLDRKKYSQDQNEKKINYKKGYVFVCVASDITDY